jgi:tRNA threonylcarbamoyladenosine biosynthesis protein TsaB
MQVAIDTSTGLISIALSRRGEILAELSWHSERNHTVELLPNLIHLLGQVRGSPQSIDAVVVARGPGSFNGLRVGISTAKGLALALGIPLAGISTLEVEAFAHADTRLPLCPIHNAGRMEIAAALYQMRGRNFQQLIPEHITTVDELCSQIRKKTLFCGELSPEVEAELKGKLADKAVIPNSAARLRRAGFLAQLGWQRLSNGDHDDPSTIQPLYLRQPPITKPKKAWPHITAYGETKERNEKGRTIIRP